MLSNYREFKTRFAWTKKAEHVAVITCKDTLSAILASIYVDHLTGADIGSAKGMIASNSLS